MVCNRSTLEQFRAPVMSGGREDKFAWNLGRVRNVQQVFGPNPVRAVLPVRSTPGDGLHYPRSRKSLARQEASSVSALAAGQPAMANNGGGGGGGGGVNGTAAHNKDHISVAIDSKLGISDVYV